MFVAIDNTDMNIFKVDEWINTTRDANGGIISPEFAMEILSKTNFHGHIKKVLKNIKENCTTREQLEPYKEFILSCIDRREISGEAFAGLREMADVCRCWKEFRKINKYPKFYDRYDCKGITIKRGEEYRRLRGNDLNVYLDIDGIEGVDLSDCDLSNIKKLKFREYATVKMRNVKKFPHIIDFSQCDSIDLSGCDLGGLKELKFREGAGVCLEGVKNLPANLDFSQCSSVDLTNCDLSNLKELKFKENSSIVLNYAKNMPYGLDVSMCELVCLEGCDLSRLKEFKFNEGSTVVLYGASNFPEVLDLSVCKAVDLSDCDLSGVKELKLGEGANVSLKNNYKLPKILDLSMCSKVDLTGCSLGDVNEIKFKDRKQKKKFMEGACNFKGKFVYEDNSGINIFNILGKDMA